MTAARIYPATILDVHDGDSLRASLSLGFGITFDCAVRLQGLNARELAMPGGPEARDHLAALLPIGAPVTVSVVGPDKFGSRWDAYVISNGVDVGQRMVADGYAAPWNGQGVKPVAPWPIPSGDTVNTFPTRN